MKKYKSLIESPKSALQIVGIISERSLSFSLNTLAVDLVSGDQGDLVIDGKNVWIFTDSKQHADRIIQYITYDPRYFYSKEHELVPIPKYEDGRSDNFQEPSSWKIQIENDLSEEDQEKYSRFLISKYFYFKEEYTSFF